MTWIIRDHDRSRFLQKKDTILRCCEFINGKYGEGTASPTVRDQYYNMREMVEPHYHIIDKAVKAMEMAGIKPKIQPIRGGTDGDNLSFRNLPCPNILASGLNFHGKMEFLPSRRWRRPPKSSSTSSANMPARGQEDFHSFADPSARACLR